MDLQLEGRRAIVTGGSRGIGKAVGRALLAEGCRVALVAREEASLAAAARELGADWVTGDTGDDASVRAMVDAVRERLGGVDILVNCAATPNTAGGFPDEALEDEINVKVRGYLRCIRAVQPLMEAQGWGRIVNVSGLAARSTGSITGSVRNVAVSAMTKNLADELGPRGINVTVVHPGMTRTERTPADATARNAIGRMVTAAEVADVIAFLCSPRSVAITGDAVVAGGGAPGPIHY
jgi:NAD(P)-dependent dehydrogenase (short-subunit alcohol dehydrogenase family)